MQPPEFKKLPVPSSEKKISQKDKGEDLDIKKLLSKNSEETNKIKNSNTKNQTLEKSILEKISEK